MINTAIGTYSLLSGFGFYQVVPDLSSAAEAKATSECRWYDTINLRDIKLHFSLNQFILISAVLINFKIERYMSETDILKGLNPAQVRAVTAAAGPVLVLAGAGSGKTKTIVHRLAYLIKVKKVSPYEIVAVTFTNRAAHELKSRVAQLIGASALAKASVVGTFHSVSCRWLRSEAAKLGYPGHFTIYDEDDQLSLIKSVYKAINLSVKQIPPGVALAAISRAKSSLLTPLQFLEQSEGDKFSQIVCQVYERYQTALKQNQAMDFDDLITQLVWLWQADAKILARYQQRFKYLLVDEYQDTNHAQYRWCELLSREHRNIYVVGDDWQSIYSWRGADFGNILRFKKDYPEAKICKLEQNYRSTQNIINASNAVMTKAAMKSDKKLWTDNPAGARVQVVEVSDANAEAEFVVSQAIKLASSEADNELSYEAEIAPHWLPSFKMPSRFYGSAEDLAGTAVLYRTNLQSRALEETCLKQGVPYRLIGGVRFYERREIKDVLAYLRLLLNPYDTISLRRVILRPSRGLGLTSLELLIQSAQAQSINPLALADSVILSGQRQAALVKLQQLFDYLRKELPALSVSDLIDRVLDRSGLGADILDGTAEGEVRFMNVQELKTVAAERAPGIGQEALEQFLTEVSLWQDQDNLENKSAGLTLMTLHAAKGMEFKHVFIVGLEEGLFPHASSFNDQAEMDEERRLCYVGLTRAKEKVYCVYAVNRRLAGSLTYGLPSRFIGDLPSDLLEFKSLTQPF